jgi:hypothetical protein
LLSLDPSQLAFLSVDLGRTCLQSPPPAFLAPQLHPLACIHCTHCTHSHPLSRNGSRESQLHALFLHCAELQTLTAVTCTYIHCTDCTLTALTALTTAFVDLVIQQVNFVFSTNSRLLQLRFDLLKEPRPCLPRGVAVSRCLGWAGLLPDGEAGARRRRSCVGVQWDTW